MFHGIDNRKRNRTPEPENHGRDGTPMEEDSDYEVDEEPEAITVETHIKPENKGFAMLAKFGWEKGQALGLTEGARVEPVPFVIKQEKLGLGKMGQDTRMVETTVAQRKALDSERLLKETEDQRRAREEAVAAKAAVSNTIAATLSAFNCTLCNKQFSNVKAYDEHTNSYAHAHRARAGDLAKAAAAAKSLGGGEEARERERKREEKELRRAAKAAGVRMPKAAKTPLVDASFIAPVTVEPNASISSVPVPTFQPISSAQKPSGWARIPPVSSPPATSTLPFRTGGFESLNTDVEMASSTWSTPVSNEPALQPHMDPTPQPPAPPPPAPFSGRSGWQQFQKKTMRKS